MDSGHAVRCNHQIRRICEEVHRRRGHALDPPLAFRLLDHFPLLVLHRRVVLELQSGRQTVCRYRVDRPVRRHLIPQFRKRHLEVLARLQRMLHRRQFPPRLFRAVAVQHGNLIFNVKAHAGLGVVCERDARAPAVAGDLPLLAIGCVADRQPRRVPVPVSRDNEDRRPAVRARDGMPVQVNRHVSDVVGNLHRPAHVIRERHHDIAVRVERHISRTTEQLIVGLHGLRPDFPGRIQCNDTVRQSCQIGNNRLIHIGDFAIPNPLPSCKAKFLSRERRRGERLRFIVYERLIGHRSPSAVCVERHHVLVRRPVRIVRYIVRDDRRGRDLYPATRRREPSRKCVPASRRRRKLANRTVYGHCATWLGHTSTIAIQGNMRGP